MPRAQRAKEPSPVTVQVMQQEATQPPPEKSTQEREEKPPTWFWDKLQEIPMEEWKAGAYQVWLTRLGDSRVPMAAGEKGYLDMFIEPITPQIVKAKYGGGKYQAVLNHRGRAETSHNFEIEGLPNYDLRRERPANSPAVAAVGGTLDPGGLAQQLTAILREEIAHLRESNQSPNATSDATVEILSNAAKKAADIMERQTPQAGNPATMVKELVLAMKELGMVGGGDHGSTLGKLVQELQPLIALVTPFISKLVQPQDPMAQITTFMSIFEKLDALRGAGGSSRGTTTNDLVLEGIKTLPAVIDQMAQQKAAAAAHAAPPIPSIRPISPAGLNPPAPRMAPAQQPPQTAAASTASAAAPSLSGLRTRPLDHMAEEFAPEAPATPAPTARQEHDTWVAEQMVNMIYLGFDGDDVVAFLDKYKPDVVEDLLRYTDEQIEGIFRMNPITARAVDHPNWKRVLAQARASAQALEAEDEDGEPAAAPAKVN